MKVILYSILLIYVFFKGYFSIIFENFFKWWPSLSIIIYRLPFSLGGTDFIYIIFISRNNFIMNCTLGWLNMLPISHSLIPNFHTPTISPCSKLVSSILLVNILVKKKLGNIWEKIRSVLIIKWSTKLVFKINK